MWEELSNETSETETNTDTFPNDGELGNENILLQRRSFLGGVAGFSVLGGVSSTVTAQANDDAVVSVDPSTATDWTIDD